MRISDWSSDVCSSDLAVPGYDGTSLPQGAYFDNPERMEAEAAATKSSNEQYRITTDADRTRPTFSNAEILETTARATAVEREIGRASCRERGGQYLSITVVTGSLKKNSVKLQT